MARTLNLDIQRRTASRRRSLRFTQRRRHVRQQDASRVFPSGSVLAPIRRLRPADAGTRSGQVKAIEIARILQRTLLAPAYTQFRRLSQPTRCRISENVFLFVSRRPPQGDDLRKNDTLCLALYPKPYSLRPTSFTLDTETAALGAPSWRFSHWAHALFQVSSFWGPRAKTAMASAPVQFALLIPR